MPAVALVVLPESPRWLVVNCRLDEALAVIHKVYTDMVLPSGAQESTAEVEQELLELWSSVEKDKAAAQDRAHQLRQQTLETRTRRVSCSRLSPCTGSTSSFASHSPPASAWNADRETRQL